MYWEGRPLNLTRGRPLYFSTSNIHVIKGTGFRTTEADRCRIALTI